MLWISIYITLAVWLLCSSLRLWLLVICCMSAPWLLLLLLSLLVLSLNFYFILTRVTLPHNSLCIVLFIFSILIFLLFLLFLIIWTVNLLLLLLLRLLLLIPSLPLRSLWATPWRRTLLYLIATLKFIVLPIVHHLPQNPHI